MTHALAAYLGAAAHPRSAAAVFDPRLGNFRSPDEQNGLPASEPAYDFNSLGFRGADYDPGASLRVFVCGCSYTFGMGVRADRTWPVVFTRLAAAALGTPIEQSLVQNFSQVGASNNYVTRTLVKQCHLAPPTLAIAAFTHTSRTEYLDGQEIRNLGHWDIRPDDERHQRPDSPGRRFFRQYSDRAGLQNLLLNMVFFQSAMERRGVPYIMVWVDVDALDAPTLASPVLSDYHAVLVPSRISRRSIKQPGIFVDAAEGPAAQGHPGPQSHERFAAALAKEFEGRLLTRGSSDQRRRAADTFDLGRRVKRASADRLARSAIRVAARQRPRAMRVEFGDQLAVEHFAGERALEIDLERRAWSVAGARLRAAYADYITADLLRFNVWLNVLTVQEFLLARGVRPAISVPQCWSPEPGRSSPVLDQLSELVGGGSVSPVVRPTPSRGIGLAARLDAAKSRLRHSHIDALLHHGGRPARPRSEDPNNYSLW